MDNRIFSEADKDILERNINYVGETAFIAGYVAALRDVIKEKTNEKDILSIVSTLTIKHMDETQAKEFVKAHPFKFITK